MRNKIFILLILSIFINCGIKKPNTYDNYKSYMIARGEDPKAKRPFKHFEDFLSYKDSIKKQDLINNQILKVNKVYIYYSETKTITFGTFIEEGVQSVTFVIYSDEGFFCLSTFDLNKNSFTAPENGIIKLKKSVIVEDFGEFEITNDFIKTSKRNKTPFKEWYDHVNGNIKNDVIHFTEGYIGKEYKFEKKWYALKKKFDFKQVYQPNLKAVKYKSKSGLTCFEVTGEFSVK
ncbi:hypothetical protein SL053_002267 [Flavobacterium psychrophilum]|nr:hypothetical protein [Flavobacterium psychrophilum]